MKQPTNNPTWTRLAARIKTDLDLDVHQFERLYPGYWQRTTGAFSWMGRVKDQNQVVGSTYSATRLIHAPGKLCINSDGDIYPE